MNDETRSPRPHLERYSGKGHMKFFRNSYDLKISDPASEETLTVVVGEDAQTSTVHLPKSLLMATSDFFARALKPEWNGTKKRAIYLPDIDPALFDLYTRWLASGGEIMIDEDDWKAEYAEYLKWRRDVACCEVRLLMEGAKSVCPVTVWDFDKTTEAWFLGDYLQSRDFQNHCLGHMYYMHTRFDHIHPANINAPFEGIWHMGTFAYISLEDVLYTWRMTKHSEGETPFTLDHHPLRRFFSAWLERFWDAYEPPDWDEEVQDSIVQLIEQCTGLVYKQLRSLASTNKSRSWTIKPIGSYWVDEDQYSEDV
jgi:hypothetical protein